MVDGAENFHGQGRASAVLAVRRIGRLVAGFVIVPDGGRGQQAHVVVIVLDRVPIVALARRDIARQPVLVHQGVRGEISGFELRDDRGRAAALFDLDQVRNGGLERKHRRDGDQ
ncbi:Uncharacterised protein [Bordetella pertussis]|nr:Uncharacterised protein [Bordetella pertussis]